MHKFTQTALGMMGLGSISFHNRMFICKHISPVYNTSIVSKIETSIKIE